ncbi:uncharacterized protein BP01DRAFT_414485 [Aspergillus saccharolyticus JOP 1030-1]|uniref:SMP-30/Gluconolactonase/LRE-like region domain-containing protein n=1 Tax=Aspergillus saccharolyticus JOP 1030-1 TaxID=1450539 RepID=A0A318ZL95_9EURO|nr:hypothetical protein BP01DRAFT_414485 [Aspergillus saccharolyticus JOP 1030-1]PYH47647.1 hypothetical protein BP01DRAFT_414485 [Aspergillus saccharolyticus JOP 1030-1]
MLSRFPSPCGPQQYSAKSRTLFQYARNGTWLENVAVRSNGDVLVTRLGVPELWSVDPRGQRNASLIETFPNSRSLFGITEISEDVFALVAGNFSMGSLSTPGTYAIWKIDLTTSDHPETSLITKVPKADFLNGLTLFNNNTLLSTDSAKGVIWRIDITHGNYSIAFSDPATMKPAPNSPKPVGINGIEVRNNYVYYTSTTGMLFARVRFNEYAAPVGRVEILARGFTPDDFVLSRNGTAYVAANAENSVLKVEPSGRVTLIAGNLFTTDLAGVTALALSRSQDVLYAVTAGGQFEPVLGAIIEPAKVVAIQLQVDKPDS